jgi:hypothetical protein
MRATCLLTKVKVKLSLCFWAPLHEGVLGSGVIAPQFLTSALEGEWSASRSGRFNPGKEPLVPHWIGGWVCLTHSYFLVTFDLLRNHYVRMHRICYEVKMSWRWKIKIPFEFALASLGKGEPGWVNIAIRLRDGRAEFDSRQRQWWEFFLFITASRPALGPTQPPIKWVREALSRGCNAAGTWSWPLTST